MSNRLLTTREIAEVLSVSPETVLRWTRRGELPAIRLPGGALRYRRDEIEDWLAAHSTTVADRERPSVQAAGAVRAAGRPSVSPLASAASDTPPPTAAKTEEERDAC
jgi:excisionase family DNA binding protein